MEWYIWVAIAVIAVVVFILLYKFCGIEKVKAWLLWAVCEAEKALGGGTGKLKLATVYSMFIERFPKFSKIMPFSLFSKLVDEALEIMREWLEKNEAIAAVIEPKNGGEDNE